MTQPLIPQEIKASYSVGDILETKLIDSGLIHKTCILKTTNGTFILQKLHPKLAGDAIARDFLHVTTFLKEQNFPAPQLVKPNNGDILATDNNGEKWRMQTFIPGETYDVAKGEEMIKSAAGLYARFHRVMGDFSYDFESRRSLHNTREIHNTFQKTTDHYRDSDLMSEVASLCEVVDNNLPELFLPDDLPPRVIHGDPKVSNVRFKNGEAIALLDLDTCTRYTVLVELGDAFRSWCGLKEDDPENEFRLHIFETGWRGYEAEMGDMLSDREKRMVPQAIQTITLELAARFLQDYFADEYFGWDPSTYPTRRAHNAARARGQVSLYIDIRNKLGQVEEIILSTLS